MLSRFVRDDADRTGKHFFFGSLLLLLSFAIGISILHYSWQQHSVLGTQSGSQGGLPTSGGSGDNPGMEGGSGISGGTDPGEGSKPTSEPPKAEPTSIPQPTPIPAKPTIAPEPTTPPAQQPTPTPVVVESVTKLIEDAGPQAEILIMNRENSLIISTTTNESQIVVVDPGQALTGQAPSASTGIGSTGTSNGSSIETVMTYDPVTNEYTEVPVAYSNGSTGSVGIGSSNSGGNEAGTPSESAFRVLSNSVQKVFSSETYFPSDSEAPHNVISIENSSPGQMYEWLAKYQFQVWPIGTSHLAIYRNGVTTLTRYPIALGLSRQSFKVLSDSGYKQVLHYPDSIWQHLSDLKIFSEDSHDEPFTLTDENGDLVYKVQGESKQLMFAFLPTSVCKFVVISAVTQEVESVTTCSVKDSVVDMLSITL